MANDITRLPKWAQEMIAQQAGRIEDMERQLSEAVGESDTPSSDIKKVRAPYTAFGKTRMVEAPVYENGLYVSDPESGWDRDLWVETPECWYALSNFKDIRVRIITRDEWLWADERETA